MDIQYLFESSITNKELCFFKKNIDIGQSDGKSSVDFHAATKNFGSSGFTVG